MPANNSDSSTEMGHQLVVLWFEQQVVLLHLKWLRLSWIQTFDANMLWSVHEEEGTPRAFTENAEIMTKRAERKSQKQFKLHLDKH